MLLVIFGAGASYDSVPHIPPPPNPGDYIHEREDVAKNDRPPLPNQLFEDRREFVTARVGSGLLVACSNNEYQLV